MNTLIVKLLTKEDLDGYDLKALRQAISRTLWEQGVDTLNVTMDFKKEDE